MKRVVIAPETAGEIEEAASFYESREPGLGKSFLDDLEDALERLPTAVLQRDRVLGAQGILTSDVGRPWPYRFIVMEASDAIHVLALAHYRRKPGYFRKRMTR